MRKTVVAVVVFLAVSSANAQTWHFWTLAGTTNGGGAQDGPAAEARFATPTSVVVCGDATFIADSGNHAIRHLSRDGQVTTWAGALEKPGTQDGSRLTARFRNPSGIAADAQCNLYIADRGNHTIRRISAAGDVTTIAGRAETSGVADGTGADARFNEPQDVAVDSDGSMWVADAGNKRVRRIAANRRVTTIDRPFGTLYGVAVDATGAAFASDVSNNIVIRISRDGGISQAASGSSFFPADVAFDAAGLLYVANFSDQLIQRREASGVLTTVAGSRAKSGWKDGQGSAVLFEQPRGIAFDAADGSFVIVEQFSNAIRRVTADGVVTTIAGTPAAPSAHVDAVGTAARFVQPGDLDVDANGVAYVTDGTTIRRIGRDGATTTLAGTPGASLHRDGDRAEARFRGAGGIAVEPTGSLVVVDGNTIRRVTQSGEVTTVAGSPIESGFRDGIGTDARFNYIVSIAVAPDGTIYVADAINRAIRKIAGNTVTTLARDDTDFFPPMGGIDTDGDGNVYLWNENIPSVFRITPAGAVTKLATDNRLYTAVNGLAVAPDGTVYLGGYRFHTIYRLVPGSSTIERFAGDDVAAGNQNGTESQVRFRIPSRLDVAPDGRLFVRDGNRSIRVASNRGAPPAIASFTVTPSAITPGGTATLTWSTSGGTARLEPGSVFVTGSGSRTVTPTATTTYSLIVSNEAGEVRIDATVYIAGPRRRAVGRN
ncbi:MAG TPA: hypothetical protein VEK57_16630 [Thermoanaerobaculia bacterium]|nr:hypothetical protein [Thermoanaerobaculia bacterium]